MSDKEKKGGRQGRAVNPAHVTITRKLQELYDSVKEETIPDHFLDLLERLDSADSAFNKKNPPGEQSA